MKLGNGSITVLNYFEKEEIEKMKGVNTMLEATITRNCKERDCKKPFTISKEEADWLKEKGLEIYRRCPDCRKKRRDAKNGK